MGNRRTASWRRWAAGCSGAPAPHTWAISSRQRASSRRWARAVDALVHRVVHDAAEGVDREDGLALGTRQQEEGVEEVRAALAGEPRDEARGVHAARRPLGGVA